jgi:hypothetical protein
VSTLLLAVAFGTEPAKYPANFDAAACPDYPFCSGNKAVIDQQIRPAARSISSTAHVHRFNSAAAQPQFYYYNGYPAAQQFYDGGYFPAASYLGYNNAYPYAYQVRKLFWDFGVLCGRCRPCPPICVTILTPFNYSAAKLTFGWSWKHVNIGGEVRYIM